MRGDKFSPVDRCVRRNLRLRSTPIRHASSIRRDMYTLGLGRGETRDELPSALASLSRRGERSGFATPAGPLTISRPGSSRTPVVVRADSSLRGDDGQLCNE
jgi:hypothetical protein